MSVTIITGINEAFVPGIRFFRLFRHGMMVFYNNCRHLISYGQSHSGHGPFCSNASQILTAEKLHTEMMGKLAKCVSTLTVEVTPETV